MFKRLLLSLCLFSAATMLHAQATPTASRQGDAQVGGSFSSAASDYGKRFNGFNIYGDFDFTQHWGVEARFNYVKAPSPSLLYEKTYEIGARYFRTYGRFVPYGKVMVGRGVFNYPPCPPPAAQNVSCANLAYNMFSLGGGTDVRVLPWLNIRADYEYQDWPSFRGTPNGSSGGLTPGMISIGAAYHFR